MQSQFTNLKQDNNYKKEQTSKNYKNERYYTSNFNEPEVTLSKLLAIQNEFSDVSNSLRYSEVVSSKQKSIFPPSQLATTPDMSKGSHDVLTENKLIYSNVFRPRKSEYQKEVDIYKRTFQIFDNMPIVYNTPQVPFTSDAPRAGINTRTMNSEYH